MVIYFMRHTAVDVPQRRFIYGQTDVPLKPTFEMEATQTAAHLQGLSFDKVYTSPLTRCVRLATFCGYPDAEQDDRLKELNFGDWEMHRFDEIADANLERWVCRLSACKSDQWRVLEDQYRRVADFLDELRQNRMNKSRSLLMAAFY